MRRRTCLPEGDGSFRVAVLDTIHGAGVIAERMAEMGLDARALEVYHHEPDVSNFDLIAAPVHLPPENPALVQARKLGKAVITHHRAVGELLRGEESFRIFEITGTHSKTSTALILSQVLSRARRVISHTTRGIELWEVGQSRVLRSGLSITPGNVILAFDAARSFDADDLVCEISLGGTGLANIGILTSFEGDYRIAGGALWASEAKLQMVDLAPPETKLVANVDTGTDPDVSFGPEGDVWCSSSEMRAEDERVPLSLEEGFDPKSYTAALSAATAAALAAGFDVKEVASALEGFDGLSGRMKRTLEGGVAVYDNSNSGLRASGVEWALDYAHGKGWLGLVVGEEAKTVCEGMDVPRLVELLERRRQEIDHLVLVGERLAPHAPSLKAATAPDLSSGLALVRRSLGKGDRILSCVKCFR